MPHTSKKLFLKLLHLTDYNGNIHIEQFLEIIKDLNLPSEITDLLDTPDYPYENDKINIDNAEDFISLALSERNL